VGGAELAASIAQPLGVLLVLAMAARLVFTTKVRTPSFLLLIGFLVALLFADSWSQYALAHGDTTTSWDNVSIGGWMRLTRCSARPRCTPQWRRLCNWRKSARPVRPAHDSGSSPH
jgi:hypothetical protein